MYDLQELQQYYNIFMMSTHAPPKDNLIKYTLDNAWAGFLKIKMHDR